MKISYLTTEALAIFKTNALAINQHIQANDHNWISRILPSNPVKPSKIEAHDLNFSYDDNLDPMLNDFNNAKMLYESLKNINETQASEEALWVAIAIREGYDYMIKRWGFDAGTRFKYRWTMYTKGKRGLIHHGIARLWWLTKMTYDPDREDPYELTKYGFLNQSYLMKLAYRNYSNSPKVVNAILSALVEVEKSHSVSYADTVRLYKQVGLIGGVSIIDAYTKEELYEKVMEKLLRIVHT